VKESPHAEVAGVDEERPVVLAVLADERQELRVSAALDRPAVGGGRALGEKVGVQVVGEQDDDPLAGRGLAGGDICRRETSADEQQGDDRRDRPP